MSRSESRAAGDANGADPVRDVTLGRGPESHAVWTLIATLRGTDKKARLSAAHALGKMGPAAVAAVPAMIEAFQDCWDEFDELPEAVAWIGPPAVPYLVEALRHADAAIRRGAAKALGEMGAMASAAIRPLAMACGDRDEWVRKLAAQALGRIAPRDVPVAEFIAYLRDRDFGVRKAAAEALGWLGSDARAVPPLVSALRDREEKVRAAAARALGCRGTAAIAAVPELIRALGGTDGEVSAAAAGALGKIAPTRALPELITALGVKEWWVWIEVADALARAGAAAVPHLVAVLRDSDAFTRRAATIALGKVGPDAGEAIPLLMNAFRYDRETRRATVSALTRIAPADPRVLAVLISGLGDPDEVVRKSSAQALSYVAAASVDAIPELRRALRDTDTTVIAHAADALRKIGLPAAQALADGLRDARSRTRIEASRALVEMGPAAVPALIDAIWSSSEQAQVAAANALGEIGSAAVPALLDVVRDAPPSVRRPAVLALFKMGPAAEPATPELIRALKEGDPTERRIAAFALGQLGAVKPLVGAIVSGHVEIWDAAAEALGQVGAAAVPTLVEALAARSKQVRTRVARALIRMGTAAAPALREAVLRHPVGRVRRSAVQVLGKIAPDAILENIAANKPAGLARMGAERLARERVGLQLFLEVGKWCREHTPNNWQFSFSHVAGVVLAEHALSDSTVRRRLSDVSRLFRDYFERFEEVADIAQDYDVHADESRKIIDRASSDSRGHKPRVCAPLGRRAWELTRDYLHDAEDSIAFPESLDR